MRALAIAAVAFLSVTPGAVGAMPSDLSADPLDRGTLLAAPGVYRVDAIIRADALRLRDGRRIPLPPELRRIPLLGTAVAVAPGGWLVTAAHVAAPDAAETATLTYQTWLAAHGQPHGDEQAAATWVSRTGAVAVPGRVESVRVTPLGVGDGSPGGPAMPATRIAPSDHADLAMMRIGDASAPALPLEEGASTGTPVATLGFGRDARSAFAAATSPTAGPSLRRGAITRTGYLGQGLAERPAIAISVPVAQGDSGGPIVDADGAVRGIVTIKTPTGGIAERATEVRQLLEQHGVTPAAGPASDAFSAAMRAFWRLDLPAAERGLRATLAAAPGDALAARELDRTRRLRASAFSLQPTGHRAAVLLGIAVLASVGAALCALGLAWPSLARARSRATGQ